MGSGDNPWAFAVESNDFFKVIVMSESLQRFQVREFKRHWPFSSMPAADVECLAQGWQETYHPAGEVVLQAGQAAPGGLGWLRRGRMQSGPTSDLAEQAEVWEAGDFFPVGAFWTCQLLRQDHRAQTDCFVVWLDGGAVREVASRCPLWADFLGNQVQTQLRAVLQQLHQAQSQWLQQQQTLESSLGQLPVRTPLWVRPEATVREALEVLHRARVGSVLVATDALEAEVLGILTRDDVVGRITLAGLDLSEPVTRVMSRPVRMLTVRHTLNDAACLMGQARIRHIPITDQGRLHSIVSERDLFTLQRYSTRQISHQIAQARDLSDFQRAGSDIRDFARMLLAQGVQAQTLTRLISQLNDTLSRSVVRHHVEAAGLDLGKACWVALGSEGREEQTISTDQDNAWILADDVTDGDRQAFIDVARRINEDLDACGYPLCQGGIMASNPACALTRTEWLQRFHRWTHQGNPQDLLQASVFFDMRALAGAMEWPEQILKQAQAWAREEKRFMTLLAQNHAQFKLPLGWLGGLQSQAEADGHYIDLKMQGTALAVDAARILALGCGVPALGTRERLLQAAPEVGVPDSEAQSWVGAFEHLQMLRLSRQLTAPEPAQAGNRLKIDGLATFDRNILRESMKALQTLQQRIELTWGA